MKTTIKSTLLLAALFGPCVTLSRAEEAKVLWESNCASCHGKDGKGNTMMGRKAECRDYTDDKVQASLDDAKAFKTIKEGLNENGKDRMKAFGGKLSDDEIKSLVAYVHMPSRSDDRQKRGSGPPWHLNENVRPETNGLAAIKAGQSPRS